MTATQATQRQFLAALYECMGRVNVDLDGTWAVSPLRWQMASGLAGFDFNMLFDEAWNENLIARIKSADGQLGYVLTEAGIVAVLQRGERRKALIPAELRWAIWERDNFTCRHCGRRQFLSIDHIVPEARGGTLDPANLQTLCQSCNSRKGAR